MAKGRRRSSKAVPGGGPLFDALPASGEICALLLDRDGLVRQASAGCAKLFRRETSALMGVGVAALFDGFDLPAAADGSRDLQVSREGRPGYARIFWSRGDCGATLLLADLEKISAGGLAQAAASAHFTAEIVHEIRNPLTSLKLIVQTLPRSAEAVRAARLLAIGLREVRAIERIADALAGLLAKAGTTLPFAIGPVVEKALVDMRRELAQRGIALQIRAPAVPCSVRCDERRLGLALRQLVGGLAHGLESGEVVVEVAPTEGTVKLRLSAAPHPASQSSGKALTVALARRICGEHGGTLCEDAGGFTLALPLIAGEAPLPEGEEGLERGPKSRLPD